MKLGRDYQITINGEKWKYRFISDALADKQYADADALTQTDKRFMVFRQTAFTFQVAVHELFHAHCHYLYLNSTNIGRDDLEEIIAEMLEDRILQIVEQARKIEAKFLEGV